MYIYMSTCNHNYMCINVYAESHACIYAYTLTCMCLCVFIYVSYHQHTR